MKQKHYPIIVISLTFFTIFTAACIGQDRMTTIDIKKIQSLKLPYYIEKVRGIANESVTVVDLYGDEADELVSFENRTVSVQSIEEGRTRFQMRFSGEIWFSPLVHDVNGDGKKEFFISECRTDTVFLHMLNSDGKCIFSIVGAVKPNRSSRAFDCVLSPEAVMDVNDDDHLDVILTVNTGYAYQPRGVYALDIHNQKFLWQYETGHVPMTLRLSDINGDGKREILFGSGSPDNGEAAFGSNYMINDTDDKNTYLTVLDSLGNKLSIQRTGGKFTKIRLFVHDITGDGEPENIVLFSSHSDEKEESFIGFWNPLSRQINPKLPFNKYIDSKLAFLDFDRDGSDDIFLIWEDGLIEIRNYLLETIRSAQLPDLSIPTILIDDITNNGEEEIIISAIHKSRYVNIIFNRYLQILGYNDLNQRIFGIVHQGFNKQKLLLSREETDILKISLAALREQMFRLPVIRWKWMGYGSMMGLILSGIILSIIFTKKLNQTKSWIQQAFVDADLFATLLLDSAGKVIGMNTACEQFFNIYQSQTIGLSFKEIVDVREWDPFTKVVESSYKQSRPNIQQEVSILRDDHQLSFYIYINSISLPRSKRRGRLIKIQDITDLVHSKRAVAWATMAQRLAHEIKTPLATVMITAQNLEMEYEDKPREMKIGGKYIERILKQVRRLQKMTDAFLKFSRIEKPRFEPLDVNGEISRYLEKSQIKIGSAVRVDKVFANDLPKISADKQQLLIALQNIVDNSLNAMGGKGILTVTTRLVQSLHKKTTGLTSNKVQLEITDTGKGIPKDDFQELFKPFYSNSPGGTGLGLVITKKIIEDHSGSIQIKSEASIGTTVTVTLPVNR